MYNECMKPFRIPEKEKVVCRAAFAGIHGITISRVRRLSEATLESPCPPRDLRGKHKQHACIPDHIKEQVDQHIRSFPAMKSHYSRSHHNQCRKYLSPFLNVAEMHSLYIQRYKIDAEDPVVSYNFYLKYFNKNFNLSFGYPKSDTCGTCDSLQIQLDSADESQKALYKPKKKTTYGELRTSTVVCEPTLSCQSEMSRSELLHLIFNKTCLFVIYQLEKCSISVKFGFMCLVFMIMIVEKIMQL